MACGNSSPAAAPGTPTPSTPSTPFVAGGTAAISTAGVLRTCTDIASVKAGLTPGFVRFAIGPAFAEAEMPPQPMGDGASFFYRFKLIVHHPQGVDDRSVTISGRHILSGAPMLFETFVRARAPGPLTLRTGGDNVTVNPVTAYVPELGIYDITVTGDGGRALGTTRVAICSSFVVVGSP